MKYLVSDIEAWRDEIAALPGPEPGSRKVGKSEAIGLVAKELQAALQRGLSTSELLEFLGAKGLKVHEDTLRLAMRKVGRRAGAASGKGRRPSGGARRGAPVAEGASSAMPAGEPRDRAGDQVGGGRSEEAAATEAEGGGPAERIVQSAKVSADGVGADAAATVEVGQAANADDGHADAAPTGAASTTVSGKAVRPEDRSDGSATLVPSAAAAGPVPGARTPTSSQTTSPAVPGGRGTFTPRSDSNDL